MNREEALNSFYCLEYGRDGVELVNEIYDNLENIINIEIDKLNSKIHKGFCDDQTQDKNYEILDKISILENIKKNLNAD